MITLEDLLSPEIIHDPYPTYEKIRAHGPLLLEDVNVWLLTDYDDVATVLKNKLFLKTGHEFISKKLPAKTLELPFMSTLLNMFHRINPPQHTRIRGLLAKDFTKKEMEKLEQRIKKIVNEIIDEKIDSGEMDIIKDLAFPLTRKVMAEIMGLPDDVVDALSKNNELFPQAIDLAERSTEVLWKINHDIVLLRKLFTNLCNEKEADVEGDLISKLLYMRDVEKSIDQEEILANLIFIFYAGHETTKDSIGGGFLSFQRNPDQFELLKNNMNLIPNAAEEIFRCEPALQYIFMYASEDVRVNKAAIKKDDIVVLFLGAANRDPKVFDNPQKFDVTREIKKSKHTSFNLGIHTCLGLHLARLEVQAVLKYMLTRIPNIKVDIDNLEWNSSLAIRGLKTLKASWDVEALKIVQFDELMMDV